MGFDGFVHLQHEFLRGLQRRVDAQPVGDVVRAQAAPCLAPVIQPLVQHLVAANGVLPDGLVHVGKAAGSVDVDLASVAGHIRQRLALLADLLQAEI